MKLYHSIKGKPFLLFIIAVAALFIVCIVLLLSGFFQDNGNNENEEVIDNMTIEDLPEEVQKEIKNIKYPSRNFSISKWEIDSKNKQIVIYAFNIRAKDELNSLHPQGMQIGEWSFKVIHDTEYEEEMKAAAAYFQEMKKNRPELEIAGIGMSSKEVDMWVYNRTPENLALDGTVILNRTIHVYGPGYIPTEEK